LKKVITPSQQGGCGSCVFCRYEDSGAAYGI
jgi:hypothetical protein